MIYFIQDAAINLIKIGFTGSEGADGRLKDLQTGSPSGLVLLTTMPGGKKTESRLHKQFAACRDRGEWFRPAPELIRFILKRGAAHHPIEYHLTKLVRREIRAAIMRLARRELRPEAFLGRGFTHKVDPTLPPAALLARLRKVAFLVRSESGRLLVTPPGGGILRPNDFNFFRTHKAKIIEALAPESAANFTKDKS